MTKATTKKEIQKLIISFLSENSELVGLKNWAASKTTWKNSDTSLRKAKIAIQELENKNIIKSIFEKRAGYKYGVRCYSLNS